MGFEQLVVFGNDIGKLAQVRIARNANAWDSTKSPSIPNSSILYISFFKKKF